MLKFDHVTFSYGDKQILNDFSLHVQNGEIVALMGASGLGKSTVLNLAAGLRQAQSGTVECNTDKISYAFQEPRLFPWLNTVQNVNAVLEGKKTTEPIAIKALEFVGLAESSHLYPHELSGGMKIRVSLARAIAYGGDLYLLDEPFAALDEELRNALSEKLRQHLKQSGASCLLVTHQLTDAERIADRIITI